MNEGKYNNCGYRRVIGPKKINRQKFHTLPKLNKIVGFVLFIQSIKVLHSGLWQVFVHVKR